MDFLFADLPEDLSPKLRWLAKHGITIYQSKDGRWSAYKTGTTTLISRATEDDTLVALANRLKVKLWNEDT